MSAGLLAAFAVFAFASSITPGPNNTMLLASGVNYGFRRTIPHMAGISTGCVAMLFLVGLGLGEIFTAIPALYSVLRVIGAAYLLWLAWHIANAGPIAVRQGASRPMTFLQAMAFQWVNPKAWIIVVGAVTTYVPRDAFGRNVVLAAAVLAMVNFPCMSVWAAFGAALRPVLARPSRARVFNVAMAALLVLSLIPILTE